MFVDVFVFTFVLLLVFVFVEVLVLVFVEVFVFVLVFVLVFVFVFVFVPVVVVVVLTDSQNSVPCVQLPVWSACAGADSPIPPTMIRANSFLFIRFSCIKHLSTQINNLINIILG